MRKIRTLVKFVVFVVFILSYLTSAFAIHLVTRDPKTRRRRFVANTHQFSRLGLFLMFAKIKFKKLSVHTHGHLVVGNHLGFVDILAVAAHIPSVFVTSKEMKETPFLGLLTEMAGCIYVERRDRTNILNERQTITDALHDGFNVVLYAEGASGNGEKVMPFKKTLIMAVAGTKYSILPVCTNFLECEGEPFSHKWRDYLCWYGKQNFVGSLLRTLSLKSFKASVEGLEPVFVAIDEDRAQVAAKVQAMIEAKYIPIPVPHKKEASGEASHSHHKQMSIN